VEVMQEVKKSGYILDPHGAVGYKGLKDFMTEYPGYQGVFLETAHPGKFRETVEKALDIKLTLPERLAAFMDGEKKVESLENNFGKFKEYLMNLD
jgi:threonine synthase